MQSTVGIRAAAALLFLGIAAVLPGCGKSLPPQADIKQSREAIETALAAWKQGSSPESLKERTPPIDFRDPAWDNGAKLLRYEIQKEERSGVSARFTVALTIADKNAEKKRSTFYNADIGSAIVVRPDF